MVEHEVAMAIHHLTRTEIVEANGWLHQAQDKMDAARQPINSRRNRYNELSKTNRAKVDEYINGVASGRIDMIHLICDKCGKTESVDFMVRIDDNIYCIECNPELTEETNTKENDNE